ncbi:MAG: aldo/keto reductase [Clostridia bacterium]|nr:aldo/keto reductase [Clostridia bacterium]
MKQDRIRLNNGSLIPQVGLGVFQIPDDEDAKRACLQAFEVGYRHIDTAHHYYNERGVGQAVKESGIPREELWITSKLWPDEYGEAITGKAIDEMLARLDMDYLDLLLLHQQVGDYIGAWKAMERAVREGKVRAIGLSNFESGRLEEILEICTIAPAVLQVECHPYYQQHDLLKRVEAHGTRLECWFPIGHGDPKLIGEPVFAELAQKYGKSPVQIILRWHVQEGHIVMPKSSNPAHLRDNLNLFDFALTEEEMNRIRALDSGVRYHNLTLEQQEEKYLNIKLSGK